MVKGRDFYIQVPAEIDYELAELLGLKIGEGLYRPLPGYGSCATLFTHPPNFSTNDWWTEILKEYAKGHEIEIESDDSEEVVKEYIQKIKEKRDCEED